MDKDTAKLFVHSFNLALKQDIVVTTLAKLVVHQIEKQIQINDLVAKILSLPEGKERNRVIQLYKERFLKDSTSKEREIFKSMLGKRETQQEHIEAVMNALKEQFGI